MSLGVQDTNTNQLEKRKNEIISRRDDESVSVDTLRRRQQRN